MKKIILVLGLAISMTFALTACGDDSSSKSEESKPAITSEEAVEKVLKEVPGATREDVEYVNREYEEGELVYNGLLKHGSEDLRFLVDGVSGEVLSLDK